MRTLILLLAATTAPWTIPDQEHFLQTAPIQSQAPAGKGITHTTKAILSDGRHTHAAHVQIIDIYQPVFHGKDGSEEKEFKDSWKFNVAAYRLARLLHLTNMVPVCVARPLDGKPASFCWWIDDVTMDEHDRVEKNLRPPDVPTWNAQMDTIRIFDQLIYNMDRSQENLLITSDWHVWMIDHTRAFRKWPTLRNPAMITHCSPALIRDLQALRPDQVTRELSPYLTAEEIDGLMARRDIIVSTLLHGSN